MEHFIQQNGYLTVFATVAFSGEFGLFAGVALARAGAVTLIGVIVVGTAASFIGNMFYFYAGKVLWTNWHFLKNRFETKVEKTSSVVRQYGSPLMLIARFFYGIRNVVPIALGIYNVNVGVFIFYNLVGAVVWAWFFTEAGGMLSSYAINSLSDCRESLLWGLLTSVILAALYFLIRKAVSRFQG